MDRKEFISTLGKSTAFICLTCILGSCSKDESSPTAPQNVDFTLDLSSSENSTLNSTGTYLYKNGIIIASIGNNSYAAVSQKCTHQGFDLVYQHNNSRFHCNNHGSNFSTSGTVINGPATTSLTRYNTQLNGNMLRVYS